jgi:hypothetical protein
MYICQWERKLHLQMNVRLLEDTLSVLAEGNLENIVQAMRVLEENSPYHRS